MIKQSDLRLVELGQRARKAEERIAELEADRDEWRTEAEALANTARYLDVKIADAMSQARAAQRRLAKVRQAMEHEKAEGFGTVPIHVLRRILDGGTDS